MPGPAPRSDFQLFAEAFGTSCESSSQPQQPLSESSDRTARVSGVDSARMRSVVATGRARYGGLPSARLTAKQMPSLIHMRSEAGFYENIPVVARWRDNAH